MTPLVFLAALIGVLGLAVGSFLNVVVYRVPRGESVVHPGSHCPRCDTAIRSRHNVPVLGWVVLRGRCATCRLPISSRYPLVEAATGLLFFGSTLSAGITPVLPALLVVCALGLSLGLMAFDHVRRPTTG